MSPHCHHHKLMETEIASALWHNVVELTFYISQLLDHHKTSSAPSQDHHSLNPHPSVTVLTYELDGEINFTTHDAQVMKCVFVLRGQTKMKQFFPWRPREVWGERKMFVHAEIIMQISCVEGDIIMFSSKPADHISRNLDSG